jgi:hypothetical protein
VHAAHDAVTAECYTCSGGTGRQCLTSGLRASPAARRISSKRTRRVRLRRAKWSKMSGCPFALGVAPAARRIIFFSFIRHNLHDNKKDIKKPERGAKIGAVYWSSSLTRSISYSYRLRLEKIIAE